MGTRHGKVALHRRKTEDEAFLQALFRECRAEEFLPLQLSPELLEQMLQMQLRAQEAGYAAQFPDAEDLVVWAGRQRVGRLLVERSVERFHLIDIALSGAFRGCGIGTALLKDLLAEAHGAKVPLRLHVRPGNPAARLYLRLGCRVRGSNGADLLMEAPPTAEATACEADRAFPAVPSFAAAAEAERVPSVEPSTSSAYFRTLVGTDLGTRVAVGAALQLRVCGVETLEAFGADAAVDPGDSFVVRLRASSSSPLLNGTVEVLDCNGHQWALFLSPIACRGDELEYESVFNRALPRSLKR